MLPSLAIWRVGSFLGGWLPHYFGDRSMSQELV